MTNVNATTTTTIDANNVQNNNVEVPMTTEQKLEAMLARMEAREQALAQREAELEARFAAVQATAKIKEPVRVETAALSKGIDWLFNQIVKPVANVAAKGECLVRNEGHILVLEGTEKVTTATKSLVDKVAKHGDSYKAKAVTLRADLERSKDAYKSVEAAKAEAAQAYEQILAKINAQAVAIARG